MEFDAKAFGDKLSSLLKEQQITHIEFGEEIGVHPVIVSYWANGHRIPSLVNLMKIAVALNVSTDYLLGLCDTQVKRIEDLKEELNKCIRKYRKIGA